MAFEVGREFDLKRIQKELNIKQKNIDNCPISKSELGKIYQNYQNTIPLYAISPPQSVSPDSASR